MFRLKAAAATAAVIGLALSGCSGTSNSGTSATGNGTLTLAESSPPPTFKASDVTWSGISVFPQAVYDTLLHANPDGTLVPWLATKWSYNTDRTVLTMTLRNDVKFTDGTNFSAAIAAENVLRYRDGNAPEKSNLQHVKNAVAVDPTTLQVTLTEPDPALLNYLSAAAGLQESPKAFDSANVNTTPVGSGPYILDTKNTVVGSSYVFTKNPKYWAPQQQHYAKLVINVYQTTSTMVNAIKGGQVNAAQIIDNSIVPQVTASGFTTSQISYNWEGLILWDRNGKDTKALGDVRVRQAINFALDRSALLKAVARGFGDPTTQIFPTNSPGYDKSLDSYYNYNPSKAKELIAAAGYKPGEITLTEPSVSYFPTVAFDLVKQEMGAVGINVNYVAESNNYLADVLAPKYSSLLFELQEDSTAWQIANFELLPTAPFNAYHTDDPTVVGLTKTIQTGSESAASEATKKLDTYIVQQAWFAPWYRPFALFATDGKTTAVQQQGNAFPYLWNIKPKA